jgi:hypothetical protein
VPGATSGLLIAAARFGGSCCCGGNEDTRVSGAFPAANELPETKKRHGGGFSQPQVADVNVQRST